MTEPTVPSTPRAWLVRAGKHGEGEREARLGSFVGIGWPQIGDYGDAHSIEEIGLRWSVVEPDAPPARVRRFAGELLRFKDEIAAGDVAVLPCKADGTIAIGRITGPYVHVPTNGHQVRHIRSVDWLDSHASWDAFGDDLRRTLRARWTVLEIQAPDAAARLIGIADRGVDPGPTRRSDLNPPEELVGPATYLEGQATQVLVNRYERDPRARTACIAHHGAVCAACGFDFGRVYGSHGEGFIHVHHTVPLATLADAYEVDPIADLVPLCPNCHAMAHRGPRTLTVAELRGLLDPR